MAEENSATDVNDDLDLGAALLEDSQSTSTEESSTEEAKETSTEAPETTDTAKTDEDSDSTQETDETTDKDDSEETDTEDQPKKRDAASRKQELQAEIRRLNSEKRQLEEEVKARYEANYRTNTVDELVEDQGLEPEEAALAIREQELELNREQTRVFGLNQAIDVEVAQVMHDFSWADPESEDYDQAVATLAYERLQQWGKPDVDEKTGFIRNINVMPYEVYEAFDATRKSSKESGVVAGQKAAARNLAVAEPRSSAPVNTDNAEDKDPFLMGFNKVK
jgi:hypothetical protein